MSHGKQAWDLCAKSTLLKLVLQYTYLFIDTILIIVAALALENKAVKSPVFTSDGNYLIWLQRNAGGPHAACMALVKSPLPLVEKVIYVYTRKQICRVLRKFSRERHI